MRRSRPMANTALMLIVFVLTSCGGAAAESTTTAPSPGGTSGTGGDSGDSAPDEGAETPDAASMDIDMCSLLSDEEITAVLQSGATAEPWDIPPDFHACTWSVSEDVFMFASITVHTDAEFAEMTFVNWMTSNDFTEVSGIGDIAYTGSEISLNVLSGTYEVEVDTSPEDLETSIQLATLILDRLP